MKTQKIFNTIVIEYRDGSRDILKLKKDHTADYCIKRGHRYIKSNDIIIRNVESVAALTTDAYYYYFITEMDRVQEI